MWASRVSMAVVHSAPVIARSAIHCTLLSFLAVSMDPLRTLLLFVEYIGVNQTSTTYRSLGRATEV